MVDIVRVSGRMGKNGLKTKAEGWAWGQILQVKCDGAQLSTI